MSRARRYPVGGDPGPIPADKPVPTKQQFLTILDCARDHTLTRAHLLVAGARLYGIQPPDQRQHEAITWARTVINYPAAEQLLEGMERDGLIVGRQAWQWAELGHRFGGAQARTTYFMTARRAEFLKARNEQHTDDVLMKQAEGAADELLRKLHSGEWERARDAAYAALQKGRPAPYTDTEESP